MPSLPSSYVTKGIGLVSDRNGVPVSASRRVAGSNASRQASPQDFESPAWWISSRMTRVLRCSHAVAVQHGPHADARVRDGDARGTPCSSGPALYSGSSLIPIRAAASAHCFFRCSVGATTVTCCTTWWCSSQEARVSAKVVLPAPGVATARKSRGCSWMYCSSAPCCQARSLPAVPQGARPGKAGERWWEAVVVTVSDGIWASRGSASGRAVRMTSGARVHGAPPASYDTGPPYRGPVGTTGGPRSPGADATLVTQSGLGAPERSEHAGSNGVTSVPRYLPVPHPRSHPGPHQRHPRHRQEHRGEGRRMGARDAAVARAPTAPPPRAANAAPPTASSSTLDRPSEICRAAELVPASSGAESFSSSTLVEEMTRPIPKQPNAQATATVQTGTDVDQHAGRGGDGRSATSTMPNAISRSRYGSSRGRDCTYEPSAQVPPPAASERPGHGSGTARAG